MILLLLYVFAGMSLDWLSYASHMLTAGVL